MQGKSYGFLGRLTLGMSGQAFSRGVLAAYTVVLVPLLIRAWGIDGYGQWIALTALTSYLGLSNFGLVTTSANDMVIATGANDMARAKRTFQASVNLTIYIVLPIIALLVLLLSQAPISRSLHLTQVSTSATRIIIAGLAVALWCQTLRGLMAAVLYATGSYGLAYYLQGAMKLCELIAIAVAVTAVSGSQVSAAVIVATVALVDLLTVAICAYRAAPWARIDLTVFDWTWLSAQAKPTVGFLVSNLATQGVMNQGPRLALSVLLGGAAVGIYSVYGTAMRIVDQLLLMLVLPLEVEIAHSTGRADLRRIERLIVAGTHISWILFLFVAVGLMLFGPLIFHVWTTGRIAFSYSLMALYLLMSAANLQGRVGLHALISTNRLYGPSFIMLAWGLAAVGIGTVLTPKLGIQGMVIGGIIGEILNAGVVIAAVSSWLGKPTRIVAVELLSLGDSVSELRLRAVDALGRLRSRVRSVD
jgi:O-antigen/teichoic acid export membrane protein